MLRTRWVLAVAALLAAFAAPGCASGSGGGGGSLAGPDIGDIPDDAAAATGNVRVTWKNLNPRNPDVTQSMVNSSSDLGQRLSSGRATSTETRVLSDVDMGRLVKALEEHRFFEYATPGLDLGNVPSVSGRKGIVVVERDGRSHGLMLTSPPGNRAIPQVYVNCKGLVLRVHESLQGFEVKVNTDADRVFRASPIQPPRR